MTDEMKLGLELMVWSYALPVGVMGTVAALGVVGWTRKKARSAYSRFRRKEEYVEPSRHTEPINAADVPKEEVLQAGALESLVAVSPVRSRGIRKKELPGFLAYLDEHRHETDFFEKLENAYHVDNKQVTYGSIASALKRSAENGASQSDYARDIISLTLDAYHAVTFDEGRGVFRRLTAKEVASSIDEKLRAQGYGGKAVSLGEVNNIIKAAEQWGYQVHRKKPGYNLVPAGHIAEGKITLVQDKLVAFPRPASLYPPLAVGGAQ